MPPREVAIQAKDAVRALRFLGDTNRVRIITYLAGGETCVSELVEQLALPQALVSYHLRRLREAGLVRTERRAQRIHYAIDSAAWASFTRPIRELCGVVSTVASEATERTPTGPAC